MNEILLNNLLSLLTTLIGIFVTVFLKNISTDLRSLKADYTKLLYAKQADNDKLESNIQEIKELLRGHYVTKQEFNALRDDFIKLKTSKEGDVKNATE